MSCILWNKIIEQHWRSNSVMFPYRSINSEAKICYALCNICHISLPREFRMQWPQPQSYRFDQFSKAHTESKHRENCTYNWCIRKSDSQSLFWFRYFITHLQYFESLTRMCCILILSRAFSAYKNCFDLFNKLIYRMWGLDAGVVVF